jgi:hypothetical protein
MDSGFPGFRRRRQVRDEEGGAPSLIANAPLPEHRRLVDELAEPGVAELEDEGEEAVVAIDMADPQRAGR